MCGGGGEVLSLHPRGGKSKKIFFVFFLTISPKEPTLVSTQYWPINGAPGGVDILTGRR